MSDDEKTMSAFKDARHNIYMRNAQHLLAYCPSSCCGTHEKELIHVQRQAEAGEARAVEIWTEFMRLRMTT